MLATSAQNDRQTYRQTYRPSQGVRMPRWARRLWQWL